MISTILTSKQLHRPLPPYLYNDPNVFQMEREYIFARNWMYVGRLDELQKPGNYLSLTLAGYPIFIYRSPLNQELLGFHNVCSHRAGPIVPINTDQFGSPLYGNQTQLKCHYHAWLYDSRDGSLKATPKFDYKFQKEEKQLLNLKRIQIEIFANKFIFVKLAATQEEIPSINTLLKDLSDDMVSFPLDEYEHLESQYHLIRCNWKTYVENYEEGYHIHSIHPELNRTVQAKEYIVINRNNMYSIHQVPSRNSSSDQDKYLWTYIYPNLAINLYEKGYSIEHILPIGKDRTLLAYDFFVRVSADESKTKERMEEARAAMQRTLAITNEDKKICEQVQCNLDAGIYQPGYLSPSMENGVQFFQNRIRHDLRHTSLRLE